MSEAFNQAAYVRMKSALTRAINSKNHQKIIDTAKGHLARFEQTGFPDDWHRWERAKEDAEQAIRRQAPAGGGW